MHYLESGETTICIKRSLHDQL